MDISGDKAIIGALQGGKWGDRSGNVYVFQDDGDGNWTEQAILVPSGGVAGTGLGQSVALQDDLAIVGALSDDVGRLSGSAFAFRRDEFGAWTEVAKFVADDSSAGDHFGFSVGVFNDTALIGAWVDDHQGGIDSGSAYLFGVPVPEPSTAVMALIGFILLICSRSVNRRASQLACRTMCQQKGDRSHFQVIGAVQHMNNHPSRRNPRRALHPHKLTQVAYCVTYWTYSLFHSTAIQIRIRGSFFSR